MLRPSLVSAIAFTATVSTFFATPAAAAPQIAFANGGANPVGSAPVREQARLPFGVSYDDCEKDATLTFQLVAAQGTFLTGSDVVQAWAGTEDCTVTWDRSAAQSGTCQPVSAPIPVSATFTVSVHARDLVRASLSLPSSPGNGGVVAVPILADDDSMCRTRTSEAGTVMNVSLLVFSSGGGADAEAALTYEPQEPGLEIVVDTVGPPAPTPGSVEPAPSGIRVSWTPTETSDEFGTLAFCAASPTTCPIAALADGTDGRTLDPKYICGDSADRSATWIVVQGLDPGANYTLAIAGVDLIGNAGPLALERCGVAGAATDGDAGASDPNAPVKAGCACQATRSAQGGAAGGAAVVAVAAMALARRRRKRSVRPART